MNSFTRGFYRFKYPKPGEANAKVECRVFDIASRVTRTMEVPVDSDGYIPRITFTKDPSQLAVMTTGTGIRTGSICTL